MDGEPKRIVNPIALENCFASYGENKFSVLDISFIRLVLASQGGFSVLSESEKIRLDLSLGTLRFSTTATYRAEHEGWTRFDFEGILPSHRASLRSFLSAKKIGESIISDWGEAGLWHYHGLNESELWFQPQKSVLFTYLDLSDFKCQFVVRWQEENHSFDAGNILRQDYMGLEHIEARLPMIPLGDRELYAKLGECRDIVTNFRPAGHFDYSLKQKLLKAISENLYSTSRRVEMNQFRNGRSQTATRVGTT